MNLEGRNEVWADDAGAVDGFENLPLSSFDFLPTVALRFENRQLTDVSSEFQPHYDRQIAQIKSQLDARSLNEFKSTDGQLSSVAPQLLADLHEIVGTKIAVLEIVWAYLYSGREQEAWNTLADMWPPADFSRIHGAIQNAHAHGISREVDAVSKPPAMPWKSHVVVYDMFTEPKTAVNTSATSVSDALQDRAIPENDAKEQSRSSGDSLPKAIYLGIPLTGKSQQVVPDSQILLNLVIDAAGKVHSAELINKTDRGPIGDTVINASVTWNFIPGFRSGGPVASRIRIGVWPQQ
jgi:hypothetical protein